MRTWIVLLLLSLGTGGSAWAQAPPPLPPTPPESSAPSPVSSDEATHDALRKLRDGLVEAVTAGDIERQLTYLHPNVVVTWLDGRVSRRREGVRDYWNTMMTGPDRVVAGFRLDLEVDELTILYGGDAGIAFGSSNQHFDLVRGPDVDVRVRWTATLVKEHDQWLVASFHTSSNLFDNPVVSKVKRMIPVATGVALVLGFLAGLLLGRRRAPSR